MNRPNIRTVNGARRNGHLNSRYIRVQNRAAAVLDAWNEYGEAYTIDLIAHLHRMSVSQIENDLYGEPADIERRYGFKSTIKLERALKRCQKELNDGESPALVAVANHVPFTLLRSLQKNGNIKEVANTFLNDMKQKKLTSEKENSTNCPDKSIETNAGESKSKRKVLSSTQNRLREIIERSKENSLFDARTSNTSISTQEKRTHIDLPEFQSTSNCDAGSPSRQSNVNENDEAQGLLNINPPEPEQQSKTDQIITAVLNVAPPGSEKQLEADRIITVLSNVNPQEPEQPEAERIITALSNINPQEPDRIITVLSNANPPEPEQQPEVDRIITALSNINPPELDRIIAVFSNMNPPETGRNDLRHQTKPFHSSQLQMKWKMLHSVGSGLSNKDAHGICKNICYINAIIQTLAVTAPFVQWLFTEGIDIQCALNIGDAFCSVCSLFIIIDQLYESSSYECIISSRLASPSADAFVENIERISSTFTVGTQQDPSEFLTFLLDHLIQCLSINESCANDKSMNSIQNLFGINIRRKTQCHVCSNQYFSTTWESLLNISIDEHTNVTTAMKEFFKEELLTSENLYECNHCKKKVLGSTKLEITKVSPVIFILLRKFTYDKNMQMATKIHRFISFPEILNLDPYVSVNIPDFNGENDSVSDFTYELYAVVVHQGQTASSGHVFSYIRSPDGLWYEANDETVTQVQLDVVLSEKDAYILSYVKRSTESSFPLNKISINSSVKKSFVVTSTPMNLRLNERKNLDDNFNLISSLNNSCFPANEPVEEDSIHFDSILAEHSSIENAETNVNNRSFISSPSFVENILSIQDTETFDDIQTESRIEIISNDNQNQKNSNRKSQMSPAINDLIGADDFVTNLPASFQFKVQSVDLAKLFVIRDKKIQKKKNRLFEKMGLPAANYITNHSKKIFLSQSGDRSSNNSNQTIHNKDSSIPDENPEKESNVDVEYLYLLLPYLKRFNQYCGLCVRNCTFGVTKLNHRQLLRCNLRCVGNPACPFKCSVIVQNNGVGHIIVTNRTIKHVVGTKICRPIRKPLRCLIKKQFSQGASVFRMHQDRLQKRTKEERKGRNYDGIGTSRNTLRKIKSEGVTESLLSPAVDDGLAKLLLQFQMDVNPDGKVKGTIQILSKYPCQVVVFSETSIRLFDALLKHKNVVISWDATGSIIKETHAHRMLYYELSITLPGIVNEDSIVPISFMISDAHALVHVTTWLESFKDKYAQVFPSHSFPQPRIVLSDRAMVFLLASLKIWNGETMNDFLHRAYRIVTGTADAADYNKTNIHACLAHVLLDARKNINKYIPSAFRDLAMWCIALLINSSTWSDFTHDWHLICLVFIQLHLGADQVNKEYYDALLNSISKIQSDSNTNKAIKMAERLQAEEENASSSSQAYAFDDGDDDFDVQVDLPRTNQKSKRRKILIDEEQELAATDSPFKSHIDRIFNDALKTCGVFNTEIDKNKRDIMRWFKYLTTSFMPTLAVWSNLLLGDLSRHRRRLVQRFESIIVGNEEQKTTGISERRMGIVKRVQLGGEVHMRLDVLLSILIPDMLSMINEYNDALASYCRRNINDSSADSIMILDEQRLKPIEERWRERVSKRGRGHYSKHPDQTVFTDLLSCLLSCNENINETTILPKISPNWLDVTIGMILSLRNYHEYQSQLPLSTCDNSLLYVITTFLDDWYKSSENARRSTTIKFKVPDDGQQDLNKQSTYILDNVFIPFLPCRLIIEKVYECRSCQSNVRIRSTITSIPVSISRSGLDLTHDLFNFFSSTSSDLNCSICKRSTTRHIEVIQWPEILIVHINDRKNTTKYRKPPGTVSLIQFSSWCAIGSPAAAIYDLVCFNSILQVSGKQNMVRVTRVKKSWQSNIHKRVIGEGEELKKLYGNSRILIFQRFYSQHRFQFIDAITRCTLDKSFDSLTNRPLCYTIQEACSNIEVNPDLLSLKNALLAKIRTYFYCNDCYNAPECFRIDSTQIFLFKLSMKNEIVAYPITLPMNNQIDNKKACTHCGHSSNDIEMNICKQIFIECPVTFIRLADRNSNVKDLFESSIKLTDENNILHLYKPAAILLISRYSDAGVVIKREVNDYIQFNGDHFSTSKPLTISKMADLMDTCGHILVFYHQVASSTSSDLRLVSRADVNGVPQIIIQAGDQYFLIKPQESNSN